MFLHCFKQRALRFGGRAIYLVDQNDLRKERAAVKHEALLFSIKDGITEYIGRKQVTRKLDALESQRERARQRLGERCLAHAGDIFNQEVAAREQTGDCEFYRLILAYDNFTNLFCECVDVFRHSEMICGNDTVRKRGYAENGPNKPDCVVARVFTRRLWPGSVTSGRSGPSDTRPILAYPRGTFGLLRSG